MDRKRRIGTGASGAIAQLAAGEPLTPCFAIFYREVISNQYFVATGAYPNL
jgi:hypothetical protein